MTERKRVWEVSDMPYLVFVLGTSAVFVFWGLVDKNAFLHLGLALAPFAIFFLGTTTIHPKFISRRTPWSSRQIEWNEVDNIEVLPDFYRVVFNGRGKRLAIVGPAIFNAENKDDLPAFYLEELAEKYDIPIRMSPMALFRWSSNT